MESEAWYKIVVCQSILIDLPEYFPFKMREKNWKKTEKKLKSCNWRDEKGHFRPGGMKKWTGGMKKWTDFFHPAGLINTFYRLWPSYRKTRVSALKYKNAFLYLRAEEKIKKNKLD